ncbi:transposase [Streptomyces sp. NPDC054783]
MHRTPWPTVYWYFTWLHDNGLLERVRDALRVKVRHADGRAPEPSAGLVDSQAVRAADTAPKSTSGFDAGKKIKDRKRFIVTDTLGLLLTAHVLAARVQDRDGARRSLLCTRLDHPSVTRIWADQGFAGRLVGWSAAVLHRASDIVRKDPGQRAFKVQPKRWAVERTFAWITVRRRLVCDYERNPAHS